ncbi:hypothetical protein MRX96_005184 [Rhipicephalus microplus]
MKCRVASAKSPEDLDAENNLVLKSVLKLLGQTFVILEELGKLPQVEEILRALQKEGEQRSCVLELPGLIAPPMVTLATPCCHRWAVLIQECPPLEPQVTLPDESGLSKAGLAFVMCRLSEGVNLWCL